MSSYSIAEARSALPTLINKARDGERVVITRHGKRVALILPLSGKSREQREEAMARLAEVRRAQKPLPMSVVELLHMDDEPER
ncbi:type II toxin-antitoxin system Phd/YefM family antitoxin [Brevundimonas sp.]|uniref:type II toxin-antitoxin system Phd/YefM family antitoxin n=1 Tax=Brevundimonas sp. TaxID=1871086 RepID=UPI003D0B6AA4